MTGDRIPAKVLATHTIANVSETLAQKLGLPQEYRSIGILTADSDDVTYCALDEATITALPSYPQLGLPSTLFYPRTPGLTNGFSVMKARRSLAQPPAIGLAGFWDTPSVPGL